MRFIFGIILVLGGLTLIVFLWPKFNLLPNLAGGPRVSRPEIIYQEPEGGSPNVRFQAVIAGGWSTPLPAGRISVVNRDNRPVKVTGWLIKGNIGSYIIGKGVEVYEPSSTSEAGEIFLSPGATLHIYSYPGPLNQNFQVNKCLGYLQNSNQFDPPLLNLCPRFAKEAIAHLSGACQRYLRSLPRCTLPEPNLPLWQDLKCAAALNQLNYSNCFANHRLDPDFLTGEWRSYGSGQVLDLLHDQVYLLNQEGVVVDSYTY